MSTVSDSIRPGGPCKHPARRWVCSESCECLCVTCWNKRHVEQVRCCGAGNVETCVPPCFRMTADDLVCQCGAPADAPVHGTPQPHGHPFEPDMREVI